ncbi:GNAT family N-acetyltransferase [Phycicoccus sp. BSK3Z-2]|uniref:GNAT family N-acetyltransferase n=1 Tax=Phycicoccus avicenniae TaxID=2828860 RepID=A0A941HYS9_9MICO|nr:GNAT family N-acetyltransferase [Phycicoccus avicenniae]MBR7742177.1 GNAT family N-acetyltransferase [Phycicoccus avicenniae]
MGRRPVDVRPVGDDLTDVTALWLESRVGQGASREACARTISDGRLAAALRRPGVVASVARLEGAPVGFVVTTDNPFGLSPTPEVTIEQLYVCPDARRLGVAKALLASVLTGAERGGCETVVSNVPTTSREANRFFARLGFGSVVTRRVVPTRTLRRRLAPETAPTGLELDRRRRSLRRRAFVPPFPG